MVLLVANFLTTTLMTAFVLIGIVMTMVVLIQRPKGGGLAGAFGGSSTDASAVFGASVGDVLTWVTVAFFVVWIFLAMGMQWAIAAELAAVTDPPPAVSAPAASPEPAAMPEQPAATPPASTDPTATE
ncbi:preprotein translocase subunit SecG [Mucisphaera sp.]|uniref:preprotein translocase subunit SecG n=1 Tax=Mucisphaera sp. TaxID=2913024 RepID=UPI003D0B0E7E